MRTYSSSNKSLAWLFALLMTLMLDACRAYRQVEETYPQYKDYRNIIDSLPHVNDTTLAIAAISKDPMYGRDPMKPVFLGVVYYANGGKNRDKFFNALEGPYGEPISARRYKSCCPFQTLNSHTVGRDQKFGLLDVWVVQIEGAKPDTLYINPYDEGPLVAPYGYTIKKP